MSTADVPAETAISRPVMKTLKALIRDNGLFGGLNLDS